MSTSTRLILTLIVTVSAVMAAAGYFTLRQREAEERLALERELRQSERLATVGRLAAGVAHETGAAARSARGLKTRPRLGLRPDRRRIGRRHRPLRFREQNQQREGQEVIARITAELERGNSTAARETIGG